MPEYPSFSLDTARLGLERTLCGQNFREVADEILSPMSWSIIGSGMEIGFRELASRVGMTPIPTDAPAFTAYYAFRPYHVMSSLEVLTLAAPWMTADDPWVLLMGRSATSRTPTPLRRLAGIRSLASGLRILSAAWQQDRSHREALAAVAHAELLALRSDRGRGWYEAQLFELSANAARRAWACHARAAAAVVAAGAALERLLAWSGEEFPWDVVGAVTRRGLDAGAGTLEFDGALLSSDVLLASYEVVPPSDSFPRGNARPLVGVGQAPKPKHSVTPVPGAQSFGALLSRLVHAYESTLREREISKVTALRALAVVRHVLGNGVEGVRPESLAFLSAQELLRRPMRRANEVVELRKAELDAARALSVQSDLKESRGRCFDTSPRGSEGARSGVALSPGWAAGRPFICDSSETGEILVGDRIDGYEVLALRPSGVVSASPTSVASHLSIVCRELGIPLVCGVRVGCDDGVRIEVDGWAGTVIQVTSNGNDRP